MNRLTTLIIAIIVVLVLGFYMFSFQVRYNHVAVKATFGNVTEPTYDENGKMTDPGDLYLEPGLYFKLPWPFQSVTTYSTAVHVLEDELKQIKTADDKSVIPRAFLRWRIADPHQFFNTVETIDRAETFLLVEMSKVNAVIGNTNFDALVNTDADRIQLTAIEAEAAKLIQKQLDDAGYGITVESVGIRRLVLPQEVTEKVNERMKSDRERRAETLLAEGEAEAGRIKTEAETKRKRILSHAESRAQEIETKGIEDAIADYRKFEKNEQLAIFLRQIQALEKMLAYNTTFVFPAGELDLIELFKQGPTITTDPDTGAPTLVPAAMGAQPE